MDPIESINRKKDSTFAMLLAAQQRGWTIHYMQLSDLAMADGIPFAMTRIIQVQDSNPHWQPLSDIEETKLEKLDCILMRKDPPFDMEYIYATYMLQRAEEQGVLVVNRAQSLRDANEKLFTAWFPDCCAPTLVSRQQNQIQSFLDVHQEIILKPLDGMGGRSIFRVHHQDPNFGVIVETLTNNGNQFTMAQRYIPEIKQGDKRILLIDGEPIPYALARIPGDSDHRGNLAVGGRGEGIKLDKHDLSICKQLSPKLKAMGLVFVGIDVIGEYLTEINVTSPTCIRELDSQYNLNIGGQLIQCIEKKLTQK